MTTIIILQAAAGYSGFALVIFAVLAFLLYFLPAIVGRNKRNATSILLLNLFLGWTFIGWIVAIIWAVSQDNENKIIINNSTPNPTLVINSVEQLEKLAALKEKNLITEEEFLKEKAKLF